ncbi:MAG: hypothetical protein IJL97_05205 [Lachnospiraceae bacterium]|nr:hypothetical protein [Lachnospiraceae bacterium]
MESSHTVTHPNDHTKGSSACTSFAGSVTIEAALAFPLFICIAVMLWFGFNLMVLHAGVENSLMRGMGTYSSFYADEAARNVWMYDFYKDMDGDELKRLGVRGGKTGIFAAAAESSGNLISIEAIYTAKEPVLGAGIFSKGVMQTVYGKSFTGYIPGSTTAKNDDTE